MRYANDQSASSAHCQLQALCIAIPEVDLDPVRIGFDPEHKPSQGSAGKQDHLSYATELFCVSMQSVCLVDDDEKILALAQADGVCTVACPVRGLDLVAGKVVLEAMAAVVAQDPTEWEAARAESEEDAKAKSEGGAQETAIVQPEKCMKQYGVNDTLPSIGLRLKPRRNQRGYTPREKHESTREKLETKENQPENQPHGADS